MKKIVYIDAQNLHKAYQELGYVIDRKLFFEYLQERYQVDEVKYFVGYISKYERFYNFLRQTGYVLIFKEIAVQKDQTIKGNVDIDIAMHAILDHTSGMPCQAYFVFGDVDYNTLVAYMRDKQSLGLLIVPNIQKTHYVLRKSAGSLIHDLATPSMIQKISKKDI